MKRFLIIFNILFVFFSGSLCAQQNDVPEQTQTAVSDAERPVAEESLPMNFGETAVGEAEMSGGVGWRQVLSLFLGLLLIAFFLFVLFRYFKGLSKPAVTPVGGFFRIIASEALFGSRYIHIVKAGNSYYFLASADNEVSLLEKIEDPEMVQSIELYVSTMPTEPQTFHERLMSTVQKAKIRVSVDEAARRISGQFKKQSDKFKKM